MNLTIDNLDGSGPRDYTAALDAERPPRVHRRLNRPAELRAWLVANDAQFVVPARGARIILARDSGEKLFTGYAAAPPQYDYLGWGERGPVYRYALRALGDESLLDSKALPRRAPLVNRAAGDALKQLANDLLPGAFNTSAVENLTLLPFYSADTRRSWSEHASALALRSRAVYRAHDGALWFHAVGATTHALDEASPSFSPEGLQLDLAHRLLNDVTITGYIEPRAYVKDYFLGDGYSLGFNLSEVPFSRGGSVVLDEEYKDALLSPLRWTVSAAPGAVAVSGGKLRVDGAGAVSFAEQVELGGAVLLQHGDFEFTAASDALLGGLYTGALALAGCFAGFRVSPSGAQSVIAGVANGAPAGTTLTTVAGHRYVLTTRLYAQEIYRRGPAYHSSLHPAGSGRGGATVRAGVRVILEVHDLDPNNPPSLVAPSTVLFDAVLPAAPEFCRYALVNAAALHCSIAFTRLLRPAEAQVRSCMVGGSWRSRLVGALSEGAECRISSAPELYFYSPYAPASNEKIVVTYRSSGRASARVKDPDSIAAEARGADDGVRGAVLALAAPPALTSADCEQAALAVLDDSTQPACAGEYGVWSDFLPGGSDVFPGDALQVNVPSRAAAFSAIVREVEIEAADLAGDRAQYKIRFANDAAEPLALDFHQAATSALPDTAAIPAQVGAQYLAAVTEAEVIDVTSTSVMIDAGADPPAGGGFEVRRSDAGWGPDNDRNLLGRFTGRLLFLSRLSRVQNYFLRQYDAAAPPRYSRYSALLHVDYPL